MRYRILEPVRQYAHQRLIERGGWEAARSRHAEYFLGIAERGVDELVGVDAEARMVHLDREHDNLRAVLRRALDADDPETALRMASALRNFWR
jgi:predicted ATPase